MKGLAILALCAALAARRRSISNLCRPALDLVTGQVRILEKLNHIIMTNQEAVEILKGLNEATEKIHSEVSGLNDAVEALEAQLEEAGNLSPEVAAELEKLKTGLQSIDDLVPDKVPEEPIDPPAPEEPADEPTE